MEHSWQFPTGVGSFCETKVRILLMSTRQTQGTKQVSSLRLGYKMRQHCCTSRGLTRNVAEVFQKQFLCPGANCVSVTKVAWVTKRVNIWRNITSAMLPPQCVLVLPWFYGVCLRYDDMKTTTTRMMITKLLFIGIVYLVFDNYFNNSITKISFFNYKFCIPYYSPNIPKWNSPCYFRLNEITFTLNCPSTRIASASVERLAPDMRLRPLWRKFHSQLFLHKCSGQKKLPFFHFQQFRGIWHRQRKREMVIVYCEKKSASALAMTSDGCR